MAHNVVTPACRPPAAWFRGSAVREKGDVGLPTLLGKGAGPDSSMKRHSTGADVIKQTLNGVEIKEERAKPIAGRQIIERRPAPDVKRACEMVRQVSEVRAERVAMLKAQIQAGTYHVDSKRIARKMLGLSSDESNEPGQIE